MLQIFLSFIQDILQSAVGCVDIVFDKLIDVGLYTEKTIGNSFTGLKSAVLAFGISLIVLKFLKKGFDTYVVWSDDPNTDPKQLIVNFIKALVTALCFTTFYDWMYDILVEFNDTVLKNMNGDVNLTFKSVMGHITNISNGNAVGLILALVFLICYIILCIQLIGRGFENFVLRVGMPIACTGLIEQNKGVFASYLNKLFQSTISVVVQIALLKLAFILAVNVNLITSIACLLAAMKVPRLLQEFMVPAGGGGMGGLTTVYYTSQMARMAKSMFTKKVV